MNFLGLTCLMLQSTKYLINLHFALVLTRSHLVGVVTDVSYIDISVVLTGSHLFDGVVIYKMVVMLVQIAMQ